MPDANRNLNDQEARLLMSRLLDGELDAEKAEKLERYLESDPAAIDWMESAALLSDSKRPELSEFEIENQLNGLRRHIGAGSESPSSSNGTARFRKYLSPLAAAAAIALVATISWQAINGGNQAEPSNAFAMSGSRVEFVDTDIPGASPVVYTDEESGWTVVWVEAMEAIPEETS